MIPPPPISPLHYTLFPYTTLFRSRPFFQYQACAVEKDQRQRNGLPCGKPPVKMGDQGLGHLHDDGLAPCCAYGKDGFARCVIDDCGRHGGEGPFTAFHPVCDRRAIPFRGESEVCQFIVEEIAIGNQLASKRSFNRGRSEEHTSELQSLMRISYAVFC